ncbi:autophagy-related protein 33 [[Candida] railenensis]|uniref:Autophagy-related protein 33 n=1 Tax=[Candida] railenensis TaxID=45579 RepID=A0A9P0QQQ0_9ASCO|nr:autophagy-related protein 33 [[Candida] railenensis]
MSCVATVKLIGASSLGLLSASLSYQAFKDIPNLISELNSNVNCLSQSNIIDRALSLIRTTQFGSLTLGALASGFFSLAFIVSPPKGKHPYLIYASLGAPIALLSAYYKSYEYQSRLVEKAKRSRAKRAATSVPEGEATVSAESVEPAAAEAVVSDDESLGKSYIHVSDDDEGSTESTPTSSNVETPVSINIDQLQQALSIEEEVDNALNKKEFTNELEHIQFGYYIGSGITGVTFVIATIGLIGDYYLL